MKDLLDELTKALEEARKCIAAPLDYDQRRRADWNLVNVLVNLEARISKIEERLRVGT